MIGYARRSTDEQDLTGTNRKLPDLDQALAARGIKLSLSGQVHNSIDPMGRMFFNILATFADLAELFTVFRTTVYRTLQRDASAAGRDTR